MPRPGHRADAQPHEGLGLAPVPCLLLLCPLLGSPPLPRLLKQCSCKQAAPAGTQGGWGGRGGWASPGSLWPAPSLSLRNQYQFTVKRGGCRPLNESALCLCSPASNEPVREGLSKLGKQASRHQASKAPRGRAETPPATNSCGHPEARSGATPVGPVPTAGREERDPRSHGKEPSPRPGGPQVRLGPEGGC